MKSKRIGEKKAFSGYSSFFEPEEKRPTQTIIFANLGADSPSQGFRTLQERSVEGKFRWLIRESRTLGCLTVDYINHPDAASSDEEANGHIRFILTNRGWKCANDLDKIQNEIGEKIIDPILLDAETAQEHLGSLFIVLQKYGFTEETVLKPWNPSVVSAYTGYTGYSFDSFIIDKEDSIKQSFPQ